MKWHQILFAFSSILLLSACHPDDSSQSPSSTTPANSPQQLVQDIPQKTTLMDMAELPGVIMKTEYDTYQINVAGIKTFWKNESQHDVAYGEYFELYKNNDEVWTKLEDISGSPYPSIGYGLDIGAECEKTYMISERFGVLDAGDYRIYIEYLATINGKSPRLAIFAEFSILENA